MGSASFNFHTMNTTTTPYEIKTSHFSFTCPITGKKIRKGDDYCELDGMVMSLEAGMPGRKL